jgi:hypothetical protein
MTITVITVFNHHSVLKQLIFQSLLGIASRSITCQQQSQRSGDSHEVDMIYNSSALPVDFSNIALGNCPGERGLPASKQAQPW